jgi:hypothetical protein
MRSTSCPARAWPALPGPAPGDHQQHPPPGHQGPGAGLRRRGALPRRRHGRGLRRCEGSWIAACNGTPSSTTPPTRRRSTTGRCCRTSWPPAVPPGADDHSAAPNPCPTDPPQPRHRPRHRRTACRRCRLGRRQGRRRPRRPAGLGRHADGRAAGRDQRFRAALLAELELLAATLTEEVGKPITQSRNELNGLLPRIDFFLEQAESAVRDEHVFDGGGMHEQISHIPLGVVANISAWNYPWFVGCNVIVPALLTGNAVLYKPSEHATLTGQHITRLLHEPACRSRRDAVPGGRRRGRRARCWRSASTACSSPAAMPPACASRRRWRRAGQAAAGAGRQGPDLRARRRRPVKAPPSRWPTAPCTTPARAAARSSASTCTSGCTTPSSSTFVATVRGLQAGRPDGPGTYIGAITRAPQLAVLRGQVADALAKGATLRRRASAARPRQLVRADGADDVNHRMELMREESFGPHHRHPEGAGDDEAVA